MRRYRDWAALAFVVVSFQANAGNPLERFASLSAPDCPGIGDFVVQFDAAPKNRTYMRVQHMGDAGTIEQAQQVANVVTWDVGQLSGLHVAPQSQRGFRDDPPPVASSAFQLACDGAGFFINTWQFSHRLPLTGDNPNVTIGRDYDPPLPFGDGIVMQATVRLPWLLSQVAPTGDGTAQMSFVYYVRDQRSGLAIAHLVGLFDSRPQGVNGSGIEGISNDGITPFVGSPLLAVDATGAGVQFVSPPTSEAMRFVQPWSEARSLTAVVTAANFQRALAKLREVTPQLSPDPADYRILLFGVIAEAVPGTGDAHNLSFGGSVTDLSLQAWRAGRPSRARRD